ncbi:MAG: peptidase [Deinococcus-Thermus bacterium]|jgi:membrane dipeptidase|nr:peptidase [Deinococcota bacterium]
MIPVFDGHNDTLSAALRHPERDLAVRQTEGHVDAVRAREGGLAGGFFAMFVAGDGSGGPGPARPDPPAPEGPIDPDHALRTTLHMLALLRRLEARGVLRVCTSADDVEAAMAEGVLAAVPHVEGAEAVCDLDVLETLHALGLRSLGLVWSRPNRYATGVPFAFPGSPDVGPGLTVAGRELVAACDRLRIVLDVSHLNEAGFWEVLERSERPVVASHSNVHALCPSPRNLTDAQLDALAERDGLVGLNFAVGFLREDGANDVGTPIETLVRHLDHLLARLGEDRVALGSDFDGATLPDALSDASRLPRLFDALARHGWDEPLLRKVAHGNWLALLRRVQEA